jgi:hypothetical protein
VVDRPLQLTNVFQGAFAYHIRVGLVGFRKFHDLVCYRLPNIVVAVSDLQRDASLFEHDT